MDEIKIDLSKHEFSDGISIFRNSEVQLKRKNFIFAKNGSGKSTFAAIIKRQLVDDYDVRLYNGFNSIMGENENLNAFALAVNAGANENKIKEKQTILNDERKKLAAISEEINEPENSKIDNAKVKLQKTSDIVRKQEKNMHDFYTKSAAEIKNITSPQISKTTYNKNDFQRDIPDAVLLQENEITRFCAILETEEKKAFFIEWDNVDLDGYLKSTNEILASKVEEKTRIIRFNENNDRINFAQRGLEIHQHKEGEICAFCGNVISQETFDELEKYFSVDEVKVLKKRISEGQKKIQKLLANIKEVNMGRSKFYPDFQELANQEFQKIDSQKDELINFLSTLQSALEDKKKNLFVTQNLVNTVIPSNINITDYNNIIKSNNDFGLNLSDEKEEAKNQLRRQKVNELLGVFKYYEKQLNLSNAREKQKEAQVIFNQKKEEEETPDLKLKCNDK